MRAEPMELDREDNDERGTEGTPLLARYLSDVCRHALLTREEEVQLGRQLKESRAALAQLIAKLPPRCLSFVLDGERLTRNGSREMRIALLEARADRLTRYAAIHESERLSAVAAEARKHKRRMSEARDRMVQANLRLVIHIVKHYCGNGSPDLDLIQDGSIGLLRAVEKFEYEKGYKFSTYAHWWIRQAVTRALADRTRTVHVPAHLVQTLRKIQRSFETLGDRLGREPTHEEVASHTQMSIDRLNELLQTYSQPKAG